MRKRTRWQWPWLAPRPGDIVGALFGILLVTGLLAKFVYFPFVGKPIDYLRPGPEWTCEYPPRGEPVCIKDAPGTRSRPAP